MSKSSSSPISSMIDKSAEVFDENLVSKSSFGQALLQAAKKSKQKETVIENKNAVISPELDPRMRELKKAELEKDLCWLDYGSFNSLSTLFKEVFVQTVDPVFWGGLFFRYSHLLAVENEVWSKLDYGYCVFELLEMNGNRKMIILNGDRNSIYDYANSFDLRKFQRQFAETLLRSIGNTPNGVVIKVNSAEKK